MIENIIAKRYARALAESAQEKNELARVRDEILALADILDPERGEVNVPELLDFLSSPTVPYDDKIKMTDVLCDKLTIGKLTSDFLNVLIRRHRIELAGRIAREFVSYASRLESIKTAFVESAYPLSDRQETRLLEQLQESTGDKLRLQCRVNPKLLAGVRVQIDDTLYDGTVAGRLERLEATLT